MALKALICPNCGASYDPLQYRCAYCGSYIIDKTDNFTDLTARKVEVQQLCPDKYPGVYVFGRLLGEGERPIATGVVNYNLVWSVGGKLLLTNKGMYFSAHALNVGVKSVSIQLSDVIDVKMSANLFVSQRINIVTTKGSHSFTVYHGKEWIARILEAKRHGCDAPASEQQSPTEPVVPVQQTQNAPAADDYTVELRKLKALLDEGIITQEEFDLKKRSLLGI